MKLTAVTLPEVEHSTEYVDGQRVEDQDKLDIALKKDTKNIFRPLEIINQTDPILLIEERKRSPRPYIYVIDAKIEKYKNEIDCCNVARSVNRPNRSTVNELKTRVSLEINFPDKAVMQEGYETLQMKGLKNKKLYVNSAALVRLDFVLLNHKSKARQPVKRLEWQCKIVERTTEVNNLEHTNIHLTLQQ
ncbi:hypothetical protein EVAR_66711_1 [Eumeta japonica]|uniref:Uncharacterized protein n=1 Tax=Eumeta variegata TaxID=151549 RepID=A0A4C1ZLR0_EUMVA|nr:hypothetical protein EVAR_66711_1 [Eumeta japonica]